MVSLNSTVSCGTMPIAARSEACCDVGDVLAVDQDAARSRARRNGTAGARSSTCRRPTGRRWRPSCPPAPRRRSPFRIDALGNVGEVHVLEAHDALRDMQRLRARLVLDLGVALEDLEHVVDVDQRLLDLAVEHAHEVQRDVELHQHRVDEDEAADRGVGPP